MSPDKERGSIHSQNAGVLAQVITAVLRRPNSALQQWKRR
jgi:ribosomal protein S12